jgi:Tol biopolymer transport system component
MDPFGRVSPDGRFITYVDWNDGRLMMRDVVTNTDRALTPAAPNYSQHAEWSAISRDSKQVVYVWLNEKKDAEFRIATLQGSGFLEPRRLTTDYFCPFDWSPDGKWIAATRGFVNGNGTAQIGLIAVADGSFRSLKSVDASVFATARNGTSIFFSPDGKYLAYDRLPTDTSQQLDVFVLAVDGSRDVPAVVHSANDAVIGWSPDGTRLLFSSDRTGTVGLWAQPFADGSAHGSPELLKPNIGPHVSLGLTASGALYVHKRISTRDMAIVPIDLEAGKLLGPPVSFTQGFLEGARNPAWSPDGRYLAYPVTCNNGCLAIRSVATGQVRRLASALTESRVVSWSPDGRSLLMKSRDARGRDGIFRIDVESGEATTVILSDGLSVLAVWSPDGKKAYFNRAAVFVERDLASGRERDVSRETGERFGVLSPDGQYFAVGHADGSTNTASLLLVPVAGGQPRELLRLTQPEALFRPAPGAWTSDSSGLLIQKYTGSRWELWLVPVTGGRPRKLDIDPSVWRQEVSSGGPIVRQGDGGISLSPDGRRVALVTGKNAAEVWALENFLPAPTRPRP